jgi:hypothetical protein
MTTVASVVVVVVVHMTGTAFRGVVLVDGQPLGGLQTNLLHLVALDALLGGTSGKYAVAGKAIGGEFQVGVNQLAWTNHQMRINEHQHIEHYRRLCTGGLEKSITIGQLRWRSG